MMDLVVVEDADALASRACAAIVDAIRSASRFRLVLAGGSTPKRLYDRLAERADIDWSRVELLWGDDRLVAPTDDASNYRMAREALVDRVAIPPDQVHRIETERGPAAADHYAEIVAGHAFDMVLLGMGTDGHTASLFPTDPASTGAGDVLVTRSPVPPTERVSLSLGAINRAARAILLVAGAAKATRLAEVYGQARMPDDRAHLPAARVRPARLTWLVDHAAAELLPTDGRPQG